MPACVCCCVKNPRHIDASQPVGTSAWKRPSCHHPNQHVLHPLHYYLSLPSNQCAHHAPEGLIPSTRSPSKLLRYHHHSVVWPKHDLVRRVRREHRQASRPYVTHRRLVSQAGSFRQLSKGDGLAGGNVEGGGVAQVQLLWVAGGWARAGVGRRDWGRPAGIGGE